MIRRVFPLLAVVSSLYPALDADAVEVLSAEELASHCVAFPDESEGVDGQYCIRYIQGFIDGAVATDVRVMINIEADADRKESFSQRAIRMRAPDRSLQRRAAGYAEFCLGDPVPLVEVVTKVVDDLNERVKALDSSATARDAVYESLRRHYPCETS